MSACFPPPLGPVSRGPECSHASEPKARSTRGRSLFSGSGQWLSAPHHPHHGRQESDGECAEWPVSTKLPAGHSVRLSVRQVIPVPPAWETASLGARSAVRQRPERDERSASSQRSFSGPSTAVRFLETINRPPETWAGGERARLFASVGPSRVPSVLQPH